MKKLKILAIIPARAGSKRLPNKNIKTLIDKPLIEWTFTAASNSKLISKIALSTDSEHIVDLAKKYPLIESPFLRPSELAQDNSSINDVIYHLLNFYQAKSQIYDVVILLQPTSPLRTAQMIDEALELFLNKCNSDENVISVVDTGHYYDLLFKKNEQGFLEGEYLKSSKKFTQEMNRALAPNGAIFIKRCDSFLKELSFYKGNIIPFIMTNESSLDIDTIEDFEKIELYLKNQKN